MLGGVLDIARPLVWQVVLAQRDLDLHARIGVIAEDLQHAPDRLGILRRLLDDLRDHHLSGLRAFQAVRHEQDVLADALVLRDHERHVVLDEEPPDHLLVGALEHFHDGSLVAPAAIDPGDASEHDVAVQDLVHLLRAQEKIVFLAGLGAQEPEAVGMADHLALDEPRLVGDEDRAAPVAHDLPFALHGTQAPLEALALLGARDAEQAHEAILVDGHAFVGKHFEDALARRYLGGIWLQAFGFDGQSPVHLVKFRVFRAQMAELVDAPVSGTGG